MRLVSVLALCGVLLAPAAFSQSVLGTVQVVAEAPTGSCNTNVMKVVKDAGTHWCCTSGTWAQCDVGAGGAGTPGGSTGEAQYKVDASTFGGIPTISYSSPTTTVNLGSNSELTLPNGPTPGVTTEGRIQWDTTDDKLSIGSGTAALKFWPVNESASTNNYLCVATKTADESPDEIECSTNPTSFGDVDGPASSSANSVVFFDDTTGKLLKGQSQGPYIWESTFTEARQAGDIIGYGGGTSTALMGRAANNDTDVDPGFMFGIGLGSLGSISPYMFRNIRGSNQGGPGGTAGWHYEDGDPGDDNAWMTAGSCPSNWGQTPASNTLPDGSAPENVQGGTCFAGADDATTWAASQNLSHATYMGYMRLAMIPELTGILFDSTPTSDNFEGMLKAPTVTADRLWSLPNASGTVIVDTAIDTSSELATIVTDETGTNKLVFSSRPTYQRGELWDSDNDGNPDAAYVGDWDGDGTYENADIRAAITALTDTGQKHIKLGPYTFAGDTDCPSASQAIVELPTNTTLEGSGWATVIQGPGVTGSLSCPIVANDEYRLAAATDTNVVVRDLTIDGGYPTTSGAHADFSRMGLALTLCDDCRAYNLQVKNTAHTCLYSSLSDGITFADSVVDNCGAFTDTAGTKQPCVYLFANGTDIENVNVDGIEASRCGLTGINNRNNTSNDRTKNVSWRNIRITGSTNAAGTLPGCASFAGTLNMSFDNITCIGTEKFDINDATAYYDTGGVTSLGNKNMTVSGLKMYDSGGLSIGDYQANLTVTDLKVIGNIGSGSNDCAVVNAPLRGFLMDGATLRECAGDGIQLNGNTGALPDERVEFRNITIDGTDAVDRTDATGYYGFFSASTHDGAIFENISITGTTHSAMRFTNTLKSSRFSNLTLDGVLPGYLGQAATVGAMGTCDASVNGKWYMLTTGASTSDCSTGSGSSRSTCVCNNGTGWEAYTPGSPRQGMDFDPTTPHESLLMNGIIVRNWDGDFGIWAKASTSLITDLIGDDEELYTEVRQSGALYLASGTDTQVIRGVCDASLNTGNPCIRRAVSNDDPRIQTGTTVPGSCNQGDLFIDVDGDGTTNCRGGVDECTLAICTSDGNWAYLDTP